jgi:protein-S-isoprenylcysteine O-methyltransferase Ste14
MSEIPLEVDKLDQPVPFWLMLILPIYIFVIFAVLVFLPAGDWLWINGWVFTVTIALNMTVGYMIINQRNPRVIRNRMKVRKTGITEATRQAASSDRFVYPLMGIGFFGALILPGIGHRLEWSTIPFSVAMVGVGVMNVGVALVNMATLHNSYASKLLDINQDQVLVDTGLYAHVRHPLYAGGILMILSLPIALGSLWGMLPAILGALILIVRIKFEEEMLLVGMEGYADYQSRVKYKLIPGIY